MDLKNEVCTICRLPCESTLRISTSVEVPSLQNTTYPLIDVLRIFTDLPVSPYFPNHICTICLDKIQEKYFFKLRYDTSITEQSNVTKIRTKKYGRKNTDNFHSKHKHHADTSIGLIKTEKDIEEFEILNEEQLKQEDSTDEFSELVTLKEEKLFVQEVKEEPEIDITDSLNETSPNEKFARNNLQCMVCMKIFQSEKNLKIHMNVHSDNFPYECKICAQSFQNKFKLKTHTKLEHEMFQCTTCSKIFDSNSQLNQHIMRFHNEIRIFKPFRCYFCAAQFEYNGNLKLHLQTAHPTQKGNLKCIMCSKSFYFMSHLNRHMIVHSDARYQCDICPKKYINEKNLQAHLRTSHSKKSQATVTIAAQLQRVYIPKQNEVQQKKKSFQCDICSKKYITENSLQDHFRTIHRKKAIAAIAAHLQTVYDIQKQNEV